MSELPILRQCAAANETPNAQLAIFPDGFIFGCCLATFSFRCFISTPHKAIYYVNALVRRMCEGGCVSDVGNKSNKISYVLSPYFGWLFVLDATRGIA